MCRQLEGYGMEVFMNDFDYIDSIVEIVISIAAPLIIGYVTNRKSQEESVFFSYITLEEEKFVTKTKIKSNILMVIFVFLYFVFVFNNTLYDLPIKVDIVEKAKNVGLIVLCLLMIVQYLCNNIFAFLNIGFLDKKIKKQNRNLTGFNEIINSIILGIYVIYFMIFILFRDNKNMIFLSGYTALLITIGLEMVYNSFISLYVKLRRWYHVSEINISIKTNSQVYKNVFNYKKKDDMIIIVYEQEKVSKSVSIPVDVVESITKIIDVENTLLRIMLEKEEKIKKDMKSENELLKFWKDFIRKNKGIAITGITAFIYCIACVIFKCDADLNVDARLYPWGDFGYNIAISIIAAVIFYVVQVYTLERKREQILKKYAKRYIKENLLKECRVLKARIDAVREGEKSESKMKEAIYSSCKIVNNALGQSLNCYFTVLSDELIEAINSMLFDDMFCDISTRASGVLANRTLNEILSDEIEYKCLWEEVGRIEDEIEKL